MTVIVTVFEPAGLIVSENKTETYAAADTEPGTPDLTARHRRSGTEVYMQFLYLGAVGVANADSYARDHTTDPTRMRMLQSVQTGAVRDGRCPFPSKRAHTKDRGI